jgi:hypothetical protein
MGSTILVEGRIIKFQFSGLNFGWTSLTTLEAFDVLNNFKHADTHQGF